MLSLGILRVIRTQMIFGGCSCCKMFLVFFLMELYWVSKVCFQSQHWFLGDCCMVLLL